MKPTLDIRSLPLGTLAALSPSFVELGQAAKIAGHQFRTAMAGYNAANLKAAQERAIEKRKTGWKPSSAPQGRTIWYPSRPECP